MGTGYRNSTLIGCGCVGRLVVTAVISVFLVLIGTGCGLLGRLSSPEYHREPEPPAGVGGYSIQIGLYDTQQEAEQIAGHLRTEIGRTPTIIYKPPFYRVLLAHEGDLKSADEEVEALRAIGFHNARRIFANDQ